MLLYTDLNGRNTGSAHVRPTLPKTGPLSPPSAHPARTFRGPGGTGCQGHVALPLEALWTFVLCLWLAWESCYTILSRCLGNYLVALLWIVKTLNEEGRGTVGPRFACSAPCQDRKVSSCSPPRHTLPFDSIRVEWFRYIRSFAISCPVTESTWDITGRQEEGIEDFDADYTERAPKRKQVYLWQCVR